MREKVNIDTFIMYMLALVVVLLSGGSMWFMIAKTQDLDLVQYYLLDFFLAAGFISNGKIKCTKKQVQILVASLLYLSVYIVVTRINVLAFILRYLLLFALGYLYFAYLMRVGRISDFARAYVNVVCVVAVISLFFWFFGSVLGAFNGNATTYIIGGNTYSTVSYFNIYYENIVQATEVLGRTVIRNTGIYGEAPAYSSFLIIALAITIITDDKAYPIWQKTILLLTIVSTLSTKGLLAAIIILTLNYVLKKEVKGRKKFVIKIICSIIIVSVGLWMSLIIFEDKSSTSSYMLRMDIMQSSVRAWKDNPLFGAGFGNSENIISHMTTSSLRRSDGMSMGLPLLLAQGGIYMLLFYAFIFVSVLRTYNNKRMLSNIFIFCMTVIVNLFISNSVYSSITVLILSCGYVMIAEKRLKNLNLIE